MFDCQGVSRTDALSRMVLWLTKTDADCSPFLFLDLFVCEVLLPFKKPIYIHFTLHHSGSCRISFEVIHTCGGKRPAANWRYK